MVTGEIPRTTVALRPGAMPGRELAHPDRTATGPWVVRRACLLPFLLLAVLTAGCEKGIEVEPEELLTLRTLGLAHLEDNRLEESIGVFRKMIRAAPRTALGHANLGLALLRMDRAEEAVERLERAVELQPEDPAMRFNLAVAYESLGRVEEAREALEETLRRQPGHIRTLYELARLAASPEEGEPSLRADYLNRLLDADPANLVVRLELAEAWLAIGEAERAAARLEEIRGLVPEISTEAVEPLEASLSLLGAGDDASAVASLLQLRNLLLVTPSFQEAFQRLYGPVAGVAGIPVEQFGPDFIASAAVAGAVLEALTFSDVTASSGLGGLITEDPSTDDPTEAGPFVAAADVQRDRLVDILVIDSRGARLLLGSDDGFADGSPEELRRITGARAAAFGDFDDDGFLDLYVAGDASDLLLRSDGSGGWQDVTSAAGVEDAGAGRHALFADLDHEGDLDLLLLNRDGVRWYRNNGDGTFLESGEEAGLPGREGARDVVFGDFDGDVDLDLVFAGVEGRNAFYLNQREGRFRNATESSGLDDVTPASAVATGDYDNDGDLDLFFAGESGSAGLYRNSGHASFEADDRSGDVLGSLGRLDARDALFLDFDNDGFLDLLVAGRPQEADSPGGGSSPGGDSSQARAGSPGVHLFRNDGSGVFEAATSRLPEDLPAVGSAAAVDRDGDGDLDLALATVGGGVRLLENEGGDAHHHLTVTLVGLTGGSGKVNRAGIGSTVELRAGPLYQMRVVTEPITHFGLGERRSVDAVRVVWTNGVPQSAIRPPADAMLVEEQVLKGSCAFVYAWDGGGFRFVTDAVWKSALGMPVGIMAQSEVGGAESSGAMAAGGTARIYAGPFASKEYVRIPGEALRPSDGTLRLRITEELWEVAYIDEVKLIAIDHSDSLEVYVDEKFVPPAPPVLRLYGVARQHPPVAAEDDSGDDVLPSILERDDVYVSNLVPGPYQGITRSHDLILDLGEVAAAADSVVLFLTGWVFPTDASINVAMSQSTAISSQPPQLQVPDGRGGWETVVPSLGFPAGKAKTVIVDLSGLLRAGDPRVRIRTNMEVYWDHIFFSTGPTGGRAIEAPAGLLRDLAAPLGSYDSRLAVLDPSAAELRYRGFSREYRKGGRHGPHWFDYDDVSTSPRWVPITGRFTRYGEVLPLLAESDDRYAILAPGDEIAVEFPAPHEREDRAASPSGWRRTYVLYTVGWIKDADMNTATGNTVEPLPFHDMSRYPYGPEEAFPADSVGRAWDGGYNTRIIQRAPPAVGQEPGVGS